MPVSITTFVDGVAADADTLTAAFHNPEATGSTYASFDAVNGQLDHSYVTGRLDYRTIRTGQATTSKEVGGTVNIDYFCDITSRDDTWVTVPGAAITFHCPYTPLTLLNDSPPPADYEVLKPRVLITWTLTAYFIGDVSPADAVDVRVIRISPSGTPFIPSEQNREIYTRTTGVTAKSAEEHAMVWSGHMFGTVAFGENQALLQVRLPSTASVQPTGHLRVYCRSMRAIVFR